MKNLSRTASVAASKIRRRSQKLLILGCCIALIAFLTVSGIGCPIYRIFGIICPGCGMTRAFLACLRLDFAAAWQYHPMVFFLPYLFVLFWKDGAVFQNKRFNLCFGIFVALCCFFQYFYKLFYLQ